MRVAVLISGRGSNLNALLKDQKNYTVEHVISNNFNAKGIEIAKQCGITNTCINWSKPVQAENMLAEVIQNCQIELIVLAGFMRILSPDFVKLFHNKIINIHPSLLPKYPGLNTHQKVLDNGDRIHGATIHLVDDQLDHGRILAHTEFNVPSDSNAQSLAQELISKEHKLLTTVVGLIGNAELTWDENQVYLNHEATAPLKI